MRQRCGSVSARSRPPSSWRPCTRCNVIWCSAFRGLGRAPTFLFCWLRQRAVLEVFILEAASLACVLKKLCRSFSPLLQAALSRPGEASLNEAAELFQLVYLQARCFQGPRPKALECPPVSSSFACQLGSESSHIGQGALVRGPPRYLGGVGRFREHLRGLRRIALGAPTKEKSRYLQLAPGRASWLLVFPGRHPVHARARTRERAHRLLAPPRQ